MNDKHTPEYLQYLLGSWREKHSVNRDPDFCAIRCKCKKLYQDGDTYRCELIETINKEIGKRIHDANTPWYDPETRKRYRGPKNLHNIYYSDDDYFPNHKVPFTCPFRAEHMMVQSCAVGDKAWLVYLLECADGTMYCGVTNDLARRMKAHNEGKGAKYTRGRTPVKLIEVCIRLTKSEALKLEYQVKQQPRAKKVARLLEGINQK